MRLGPAGKRELLVTLAQFFELLASNPFLALVIFLVLGTIFVNGATDAANAIAEVVGTRSMDIDSAIMMSVICNFIGLIGMTLISTAVADTISGMVDFGGDSQPGHDRSCGVHRGHCHLGRRDLDLWHSHV